MEDKIIDNQTLHYIKIFAFILAVFIAFFAIKSFIIWIKQKLNRLNTNIDFAKQIYNDIEKNIEKPKSVSSMTRIFLPQIQEDFNHFNWSEIKSLSENALKSFLLAISLKNTASLQNISEDILHMANKIIQDDTQNNIKRAYKNINIYDTQISDYRKTGKACTIIIQSAVGFYYTKSNSEDIIDGNEKLLTQTKYEIFLTYSQNTSLSENDNCIGITCPNCGAPITNLGIKKCEYCGSEVNEINMNIWKITYIKEMSSQKI